MRLNPNVCSCGPGRIRLWRMDKNNTEEDYPFVCDTVIDTGHRANVFNAQMLPYSSRMYVMPSFLDKEDPEG